MSLDMSLLLSYYMAMILPLRRPAPVTLRVGFNSHVRLGDAVTGHECQGAEAPADLIVVESRWVERHRRLAQLAAAKQRLLVVTQLSRRGVTEVMATIGPIGTSEDAGRLLCLVRELARAELSVHVSHVGTLGLAALVVGARSFDSGELGALQTYDFVSRRRRI